MIGLHTNQLYIIFRDQFTKEIKQSLVPHLGLTDKRQGKANGKLHPLTHKINKHAGCRVVTVLRYLSKVAFIHLLIKKTMRNMFNGRSAWNWLCGELQPSWLMHNRID